MTQTQFAELVGVSQQAISSLVGRGVLNSGDTGAVWLKHYCENLREQAAGRASMGDLDLVQERARLAKEQADRVEMQNQLARKEVAPVNLIELVLADVARKIISELDAIPVELKRNSKSISSEDLQYISNEIVKARNKAAQIELNLDDLNGYVGDSQGD
ncbi:terminase small subunit [Undibacterium macrobrachii]|nr:terminase small subunit [Undibacterium macrobrachii]